MIEISKQDGTVIRSFENDDVFNHLTAGELLEDFPEVDQKNWTFSAYSPKDVRHLFENMEKPVPLVIEQACRLDMGAVESCYGDFAKPLWAFETYASGVGNQKKEWFIHCCKMHGYIVKESQETESQGEPR